MELENEKLKQCVIRFQGGDQQAFEEIYNQVYRSGYFTALKILKDEDLAQDVLHDSFVKTIGRINELEDPSKFLGWFHQIVANKAKNELAKSRPMLFASEEDERDQTESIPDDDQSYQPEQSEESDQLRRQVMEIIDGLTDEKRTCVLLYYYNNMSIAEISETVGASESTVKARLLQARKDIKKEIEKLGGKFTFLSGVAPIPVLIWALRTMLESDAGSMPAVPPAAALLQETAAVSATAAQTAAVGAGAGAKAAVGAGAGAKAAVGAGAAAKATVGGGLAAKIAALSVGQKIVAAAVAAGIVAGTAGTAAVVKKANEEAAMANATAVGEESTTAPEPTLALEASPSEEPSAETLSDAEISGSQTATDPETSRRSAETVSQGNKTERNEIPNHSVVSTAPNPQTSPTETTATQPTTTERKSEPPTTEPPTPQPTTQPPTTTENPKGTATVSISYSVADYDESGTTGFTVQEGDAITEAMIENAVRSALKGSYTGVEIFLRSGSPVSAAEAKTYNYTVIVYTD